MTANELADWIENGSPFGDYKTAKQASSMLRQQAKKIEALKLRELTYEEISDIRDEHLAPKECDIYTFAKAILKAASE